MRTLFDLVPVPPKMKVIAKKQVAENVFAWHIENDQWYCIGAKVIDEIETDTDGVIITPVRKFLGSNNEWRMTTERSFKDFQEQLKIELNNLKGHKE